MVLGLEVQKDSKHSSNKAEVFSTLVKDKKNHNSFLSEGTNTKQEVCHFARLCDSRSAFSSFTPSHFKHLIYLQEHRWSCVLAHLRGCFGHRRAQQNGWLRLPDSRAPATAWACLWQTRWPAWRQNDRRSTTEPRKPLKSNKRVYGGAGTVQAAVCVYLALHRHMKTHLVVDLPGWHRKWI